MKTHSSHIYIYIYIQIHKYKLLFIFSFNRFLNIYEVFCLFAVVFVCFNYCYCYFFGWLLQVKHFLMVFCWKHKCVHSDFWFHWEDQLPRRQYSIWRHYNLSFPLAFCSCWTVHKRNGMHLDLKGWGLFCYQNSFSSCYIWELCRECLFETV